MPAIAMFLLKYWKYIVPVLLVLVFLGYWSFLKHKISSQAATIVKQDTEITQLKNDLKTSELNFGTCQQANSDYAELVTKQNSQILKQVAANKKIAARYDELVRTFEKIKHQNEILMAQIDQIDTHAPCDEQVNQCFQILEGTPR